MFVNFLGSLKNKIQRNEAKNGYNEQILIVEIGSPKKSIAAAKGIGPIDAPTTKIICPVPCIDPTCNLPKYLAQIYPNSEILKALLIPKITEYIIAFCKEDAKVIISNEHPVTIKAIPIILCVWNLSNILPIIGINNIMAIIVGINNVVAIWLERLKYSFKIVTWKKCKAVTNIEIEKKENAKI